MWAPLVPGSQPPALTWAGACSGASSGGKSSLRLSARCAQPPVTHGWPLSTDMAAGRSQNWPTSCKDATVPGTVVCLALEVQSVQR